MRPSRQVDVLACRVGERLPIVGAYLLVVRLWSAESFSSPIAASCESLEPLVSRARSRWSLSRFADTFLPQPRADQLAAPEQTVERALIVGQHRETRARGDAPRSGIVSARA